MKVNLYLVHETENARLFRRIGQKASEPDIWIPRSQINRMTKFSAEQGKLPLCELDISDWIARQKGLD